MTYPALDPHPMTKSAHELLPRVGPLAAVGAVLIAAAFVAPAGGAATFVLAAGLACAATAALVGMVGVWRRRSERRLRDIVMRLVDRDPTPAVLTDTQGVVSYRNGAAAIRFGGLEGRPLARLLDGLFAAPSTVVGRLREQAAATGIAQEEVTLRREHLRLVAHRVGQGCFLWRLEGAGRGLTAADGHDIALPMIVASKAGAILSMNAAAERIVSRAVRTLDALVEDAPLRPGEPQDIRTRTGTVQRIVFTAEHDDRRELYLLPVRAVQGEPAWQFFDALPVPLLKIARSGEVRMANRLARDLLADQMAVGTPLSSLVEGLGRPIGEWLADAVEGRGLGRPEVVQASRPSKEVYLQITLGRVEEEGDVSLVAVLNDATELKTLEAQFVQSQKMQAIGQLAGGVAHDFNNLLTAISGHCDLLLMKRDEGDPDYADLAQIAQNANRAASLVGQLLAFSRKQNLQPQLLDLRDSLSDLTHLLNRLVGEKVSLSVSHGPDHKMIRADKRQLEQVIMNLVVNARDAMPNGGAISIATETVMLTQALERDRATVPAGEYVLVKVADEGIGIPADKLPKIFEPFFTTKRTGEGTGLGLSTAYGIVKQTGGFIFADSEVGRGTTFSLYFPAHDEPAAVAPRAPSDREAPVAQGEGLVLLVEDEAPVRAFASRALRMRGYTVIEAENAEEALKLLDDDSLHVDVFVTDVVMPGMDGPTWVKKALEKRPDTRVVFVSGYAEDSLEDSQSKFPNSVFLPKPFSLKELTETVHAQITAA